MKTEDIVVVLSSPNFDKAFTEAWKQADLITDNEIEFLYKIHFSGKVIHDKKQTIYQFKAVYEPNDVKEDI